MPPFEELAQKARDPKALTFERKNAVQELAKRGDAGVVDVLGALLDDREASIRREAIAALGAIKTPEATELLILALDDKDRSCVRAALEAIGNRNDAVAVPVLQRLVETADFPTRIEAERLLKQFRMGEGAEGPHDEPVEAPPAETRRGEPMGVAPPASPPKASRVEPPPPPRPVPPPPPSRGALHGAPGGGKVPRAPAAVAPPLPEVRPVQDHVLVPPPLPPPPPFRSVPPPPPPNVRRHGGFAGARSPYAESHARRSERGRGGENAGMRAAVVVFLVIVFFILAVSVCSRR